MSEAMLAQHGTERAGGWWNALLPCRDADLNLFFNGGNAADTKRALELCRSCPVRSECLDAAMAEERRWAGRFGIRGGRTAKQRAAMGGLTLYSFP